MRNYESNLIPLSIDEQILINGGTDRSKEGETAGKVAAKVVRGFLTLVGIAVLII